MTKDEQIKHLVSTLESIRDDYAPWHGEDAVDMMNAAHYALVDLDDAIQKRIGGQMKTESCGTCKYRTGSRCNKNKEYMEDSDWCSAYKVIPNATQERKADELDRKW